MNFLYYQREAARAGERESNSFHLHEVKIVSGALSRLIWVYGEIVSEISINFFNLRRSRRLNRVEAVNTHLKHGKRRYKYTDRIFL